jgi:hypothetical protein
MGQAGYQSVTDRMQPLRPLDCRFDTPLSRGCLALLQWLQPRLRSWYRCGKWQQASKPERYGEAAVSAAEFSIWSEAGKTRDHYLQDLLAAGWKPGGTSDVWDVEKEGTRLLLATERGDGIGATTLVRVWGDRRSAEELLRRA